MHFKMHDMFLFLLSTWERNPVCQNTPCLLVRQNCGAHFAIDGLQLKFKTINSLNEVRYNKIQQLNAVVDAEVWEKIEEKRHTLFTF